MRRPYFVKFFAFIRDEQIHIHAALARSPNISSRNDRPENAIISAPWKSLGLIRSGRYRLLICGLDDAGNELYKKTIDSNSFGIINSKIPARHRGVAVEKLQAYETKSYEGLEILLGSYLPTEIKDPKKIIISDFDKTLVDTKYSTFKEVYTSLKSPISDFPRIDQSLKLFRSYLKKDFHPFILSASPHFYEVAIRDWLYQNKVFTNNIFLKDYRGLFSLREGVLTPKDIKSQSFYKLSQLINILNLTGVPEELVLVGDCFETDELIYLSLAAVLQSRIDPWQIWNQLKQEASFKLTTKQTFYLLSQLYSLSQQAKKIKQVQISIHIRCRQDMLQTIKNRTYSYSFIQEQKERLVDYYTA